MQQMVGSLRGHSFWLPHATVSSSPSNPPTQKKVILSIQKGRDPNSEVNYYRRSWWEVSVSVFQEQLHPLHF